MRMSVVDAVQPQLSSTVLINFHTRILDRHVMSLDCSSRGSAQCQQAAAAKQAAGSRSVTMRMSVEDAVQPQLFSTVSYKRSKRTLDRVVMSLDCGSRG